MRPCAPLRSLHVAVSVSRCVCFLYITRAHSHISTFHAGLLAVPWSSDKYELEFKLDRFFDGFESIVAEIAFEEHMGVFYFVLGLLALVRLIVETKVRSCATLQKELTPSMRSMSEVDPMCLTHPHACCFLSSDRRIRVCLC